MTDEHPTVPDVSKSPCRDCGNYTLYIEWHDEHIINPNPHSLPGAQLKFSATGTRWPWCHCDTCGAASKGKIERPQ